MVAGEGGEPAGGSLPDKLVPGVEERGEGGGRSRGCVDVGGKYC